MAQEIELKELVRELLQLLVDRNLLSRETWKTHEKKVLEKAKALGFDEPIPF